jgi:hypothetical protein
MAARRVIYTPSEPVVGIIGVHTWPWPDNLGHPTATIDNPVIAGERMYWRATGKLAYPAGLPYPASEQDLLVGEVEHHAHLRSVETRVVTAVPEQRTDMLEVERRAGGRPRLPRDADGNILR